MPKSSTHTAKTAKMVNCGARCPDPTVQVELVSFNSFAAGGDRIRFVPNRAARYGSDPHPGRINAACVGQMGNDCGSKVKLRNSPGEHQGAMPFSCNVCDMFCAWYQEIYGGFEGKGKKKKAENSLVKQEPPRAKHIAAGLRR